MKQIAMLVVAALLLLLLLKLLLLAFGLKVVHCSSIGSARITKQAAHLLNM